MILATILQESLARPARNLFFGFFWLFFGLGILLGSWRAGKFYAGIFTAAIFVVIAGIEWKFGSDGGWIVALTTATIAISLGILNYCRNKRAQSSETNSDRRLR